jgi:hypothetical protein
MDSLKTEDEHNRKILIIQNLIYFLKLFQLN